MEILKSTLLTNDYSKHRVYK